MNALFFALIGFVAGATLQLQQKILYEGWIYVLIMSISVVFIAQAAIKTEAIRGVLFFRKTLLILGFLMLGFAQTGWRAVHFQAQALQPALEGVDLRITGIVAGMPQRMEDGLRFRLDVESAQSSSEGGVFEVALPQRIQLSWYRSLPRMNEEQEDAKISFWSEASKLPRAGERWQLTVRLKAPHGNMNPHGFDYELWLWEQGIGATGYVRDARTASKKSTLNAEALRIEKTYFHPIETLRQNVRDAIFSRVPSVGLAGVIAALSIGDQASIERNDWDIYRATGVAHLMSISGLHITMFAWGAMLLVGALWRRSMRLTLMLPAQHAALIAGVVLAALYALFAGWGIPAQRTVLMLAAVALLKLSGKRWPWPWVWLLACAVIVAFDPWALLSAGFWLSFVAVGILFASDSGAFPADSAWLSKIKRFIKEQWVISLSLAPLSLLLFQQISVIGLLANMIAIPCVTLLVTPLALLGAIFAPLWDAAAWATQLLGQILTVFAAFKFATFSIASPALFSAIMAILGGVLLVTPLPKAWRAMGALMIVPIFLTHVSRPAQGEFALLAADIGQGNAVLVQTANHSLLYDAGPRFSRESDAGQRTLVPLLRGLGEKLDVLLISHRDADHIGGAAAVLKMQTEARLISSVEDKHELSLLRKLERCAHGQRWIWDDVRFEVIHPTTQDYEATNKSNAMSCVLRISNDKQTALLTGDIEAAQELRLIGSPDALKADVLLVPHHGSLTSSTPQFLDAVNPRIAWVQAGYRNRFAHPVAAVMQRYQERNIAVFQSPACGAATWQSAAPEKVICERQKKQRYWHHRL